MEERSILGKVTLVVNSCDAYQDLWPMFFCALEEYWSGRTCNTVLNTETKNIDFKVDNLTVHNFRCDSGHDKWGMRLIKTLESIESEYVLVVYDDFILEASLDAGKLCDLVEYMEQDKNIAVFYLTHIGLPVVYDNKYAGQARILDAADYRLSSAPGLWRRNDLIRYTGDNDTPWAWEVFGSYRTYNDGKIFYAPEEPKHDLYKYNYVKGGAIYRGKWVPEVVLSKKAKYGLSIDFNLRGFADGSLPEKRSLTWKLKFLSLGFRMVGFKVIYFFLYYIKAKLDRQ